MVCLRNICINSLHKNDDDDNDNDDDDDDDDNNNNNNNNHSLICHMTGLQTFPKPVLQRARSSASSFIFRHPLVFLRSSSSC